MRILRTIILALTISASACTPPPMTAYTPAEVREKEEKIKARRESNMWFAIGLVIMLLGLTAEAGN